MIVGIPEGLDKLGVFPPPSLNAKQGLCPVHIMEWLEMVTYADKDISNTSDPRVTATHQIGGQPLIECFEHGE